MNPMAIPGMVAGTSLPRVSAAPYYVHWGVVQISLPNLLVIAGMVLLFVLALVLPFPHQQASETHHGDDHDQP
jgi:hypothetical protein